MLERVGNLLRYVLEKPASGRHYQYLQPPADSQNRPAGGPRLATEVEFKFIPRAGESARSNAFVRAIVGSMNIPASAQQQAVQRLSRGRSRGKKKRRSSQRGDRLRQDARALGGRVFRSYTDKRPLGGQLVAIPYWLLAYYAEACGAAALLRPRASRDFFLAAARG